MKAIVYHKYGSPDVLKLEEVAVPTPTDDEVLIKVYAVSLNGSDREGLIKEKSSSLWNIRWTSKQSFRRLIL